MPSPEEHRQLANDARDQAHACRSGWERQGLLIIADQYERLAAYKDLTASSPATAPAQIDLKEAATLWSHPLKPGDGGPNKQPAPIILGAKS
jgi:hypothetical protein